MDLSLYEHKIRKRMLASDMANPTFINGRLVVGHSRHIDPLPAGSGAEFRLTIGGGPKYFIRNNRFNEINTNWNEKQVDTEWIVDSGIYNTFVNSSGIYGYNHEGHIFTFGPHSFEVTSNNDVTRLEVEPNYAVTPVVSGNTITWNDFFPIGPSALTLQLIYDNDIFREILTIPQAARDWLISEARPNWHQIVFASQVQYANLTDGPNMSGVFYEDDGTEVLIDYVSGTVGNDHISIRDLRNFVSDGLKNYFPEGYIYHEDYDIQNHNDDMSGVDDTLVRNKKRSVRFRKGVVQLLQNTPFASMSEMQTGTLIKNETTTFKQGVSPAGYSSTADTRLNVASPTKNFGANTSFRVVAAAVDDEHSSLLAFGDLGNTIASGSIVSTAAISLDCRTGLEFTGTATGVMGIYQCLKPWIEARATWNYWDKSGPSTFGWGVVGARSGELGPVEESQTPDGDPDYRGQPLSEGSGEALAVYTHRSTAINRINVVSGDAGGVPEGSGFVQLIQDHINNVFTDSIGFVLHPLNNTINLLMDSSENATASQRPELTIDYTSSGTILSNRFNRINSLQDRGGFRHD
jgi:hypothetical protein